MDNSQQLTEIAESIGYVRGRVDDMYKELKGNGQPGFITKTNDRLTVLEVNNRRRLWIERGFWTVVTFVITLLIGLHDHVFAMFKH